MDILKELDSELSDLLVLGLDNLNNNYRFNVLRKRFNEIREHSVVLEKISDYINELYAATNGQKGDIYLKLTNFNNALLTYISDYDLNSIDVEKFETYNMPYNFKLGCETLKYTKELLSNHYITGKWSKLYEIYITQSFLDNRLIETILDQLDNSYTYIEWETAERPRIEFAMSDIIAKFGVPIIDSLKDRYYEEIIGEDRKSVKSNIVSSLYKISKEELNKFIYEILLCNFKLDDKKRANKEANILFNCIINFDDGEEILEDIYIDDYKASANKVVLKRRRERQSQLEYINLRTNGVK